MNTIASFIRLVAGLSDDNPCPVCGKKSEYSGEICNDCDARENYMFDWAMAHGKRFMDFHPQDKRDRRLMYWKHNQLAAGGDKYDEVVKELDEKVK